MPLGPFIFMTSVESVQLTGRRAASLEEFFQGLGKVDGASIYHHTHRFYRRHSFLGHADRSDFSLWVGENLKESAVGERLGGLDLRDYRTIDSLREALLRTLEPLREVPERWARRVPPGLEFHFCHSTSLVFPTGHQASNLEEFQRALERVDASCLYFHMIESPLHFSGIERKYSNDLSQWLAEMGFPAQAGSIAAIDPYQGDLESLRERVLDLFRSGRLKTAIRTAVGRLEREPEGEAAALWIRRWRKEG